MNCPVCGSQLEHAGQGHTCAGGSVAAAGPPQRWQIAFWAVLLAAVVLAALSLLRAAIGADLITSPDGLPVTALAIAVPALLLVTFGVWSNVTKGVVEGYGGMVAVVRNWAVSAGSLILFLAYLLPAKAPTAFHLARAAGAILLVIGLLISRGKLQRWLIPPATPPGEASSPRQVQVQVPPQLRAGPQTMTPPAEPQPRDWDASQWDPDIQADIERRRHRGKPTA
jgi:hypothetical protein